MVDNYLPLQKIEGLGGGNNHEENGPHCLISIFMDDVICTNLLVLYFPHIQKPLDVALFF